MIFTGKKENKILGMNDILQRINHRCIICSHRLKKGPLKRYCNYNTNNHLFQIIDHQAYNISDRYAFRVQFKDVYGNFFMNAIDDNAFVNYVNGAKDNVNNPRLKAVGLCELI